MFFKYLVFLSVLFCTTANAFHDKKIVNELKNRLDLGTYHGVDANGDICEIVVSEGTIPNGKDIKASYHVTLNSKNGEGSFYFFTNRNFGGRGDNAKVELNSPSLFELTCTGSHPPTFSHPKRSSDKGIGFYHALTSDIDMLEIATYNYYYDQEFSCTIIQ